MLREGFVASLGLVACGGLAVGCAASGDGSSGAVTSSVAGSGGGAGAAGGGGAGRCEAPHLTCDGACVQGACDFAVTSIAPKSPKGSSGGASDWVSGGTFFTLA